MRPAEVVPLIQTVAATLPRQVKDTLISCQVTEGWADGLSVSGHPDWPGLANAVETEGSGLALVVVARDHGSTASACSFLVDTWCLGVKNTIGPKSVERRKLPGLAATLSGTHPDPMVSAPLELAQQLVFGAVAYARDLGFDPHPDFDSCAGHLGAWDGTCDITFGRNGEPFYIAGPYDDQARILRKLSNGKRGWLRRHPSLHPYR
jgi:hypothetical protein